ncbi:DUF2169 domain-containing protein [Erwinia sp.]|uniref:DUF2169 family type VI secretion system accessory protein n=1 Tax=Erwinia citreus TaxID=558 RepID=UPI0028A213BF|nr:DUF2169 domain-containing protein [Erwinia sp.]
MENFKNLTPFPALLFESLDQHDHGFTTVVARLSYDLNIHSGTLTLCEDQGELVEQDSYFGETGRSSTRFESDLAPYKPRLDVVINATAWAPEDKPVKAFTAGIQIGDITRLLRINGAREWRKMLASWQLSDAQPLTSLDIRYEYAAGGFYQPEGEDIIASPANTVGMGWYPPALLKKTKAQRLAAPQIEWVTQPVEKIDRITQPAGFGFYGRGWQGRIEYAGSYDKKWQKERHPLLPQDFSFDYWCGAHPYMQFPFPQPLKSLPVKLRYLIAASEIKNQHIQFSVPVETLFVFITTLKGAGVAKDMLLDTLVIDLATKKVHCSYRVTTSELMEPVVTELRFIAAEQREQQLALATRLNGDPHSQEFVPLPPCLLGKLQEGKTHG